MDHRKIVARLAWSLCLLCVVLCAPLLWPLNDTSLIGFIRETVQPARWMRRSGEDGERER